ncbi:MAG: Rne/Rng family ribonuclease [Hyphomicrobiales bacterium]|nr:Rne/Rng family ribonuclease [Hyphomicrobiales bacterium]
MEKSDDASKPLASDDSADEQADIETPIEIVKEKKPKARRTKRIAKSTKKDTDDNNSDEIKAEPVNSDSQDPGQEADNIKLAETGAEKNSPEDGDKTDLSESEEATDNQDKPTSIAAIVETESISEPAPDEDASDEETQSKHDEPEQPSDNPAPKKQTRSTRRTRKKPAKKEEVESKPDSDPAIGTDKSTPTDKPADAKPVTAELDLKDENPTDKTTDSNDPSTDEVQSANDDEETAKPKSRRRRRSTRSRKIAAKSSEKSASPEDRMEDNNGDDNGDGDEVETSGQEDVLEEVPQRRRSRKQYKIQEVVKRRQVLLVQVVKEERGNKGAALTTYLSLAGRYSVLMPNTARGGGISRKITNAADRKRLKTIAAKLDVPEGMGVILRTAGASRTKEEIQRDFEYLMRLWENVRSLTLSSSAPCLVYEEGSLIKRSIRDLYDKNTGEVLVAGEAGHKEAKDFMTMLMPSHASKVSLYQDEQAMFARFGVEQQLDKMLSQQVTLKSGGYLVIDQTEALVAIDVNSGRATREHSVEDTALQTNLETAEEVARQLRLRDLAGLIVIDFIDMEEKRNNRAVEKKLKECLKHDRARIQVGRISHFGLLEMSRQRMRASVLDSTVEACPHCQGKGYTRSNSSVSLHILRSIEEHLLKNSRFDLVIKAPTDIASYILNHKRAALMEIEERFGVKMFIDGHHHLLGENYTIEKGAPSHGERKPVNHVQVGQISDDKSDVEGQDTSSASQDGEEITGKRKRRRRRGRDNKEEKSVEVTQSASNDDLDKETGEDEKEAVIRKRSRGKRAGRDRTKVPDELDPSDNKLDIAAQSDQSSNQAGTEEVEPELLVKSEEKASLRTSRNTRPRKTKPKAEAAIVVPDTEITESSMVESDDSISLQSVDEGTSSPQNEPPRAKRRTTRRRSASKPVETETTDVPQEETPEQEQMNKVVASSDEAEPAENSDAGLHAAGEMPVASEEPNDNANKRGGWWSRNGFFK